MKQEPVAWTTKLQLEWLNNLKNNSAIMWNSNDRNKMGIGEESVLIPLYTSPRELSDAEILEAIEEFREWTNPPYKAYEDTYMDGWLDACNEIYSAVFAILKKASEK